jgi:predicted nucleic-acid-binding Zn-ribbon protein
MFDDEVLVIFPSKWQGEFSVNEEFKCVYCGSPAIIEKYLAIPGMIAVPNIYDLCAEHAKKTVNYSDIYNEDGSRKNGSTIELLADK